MKLRKSLLKTALSCMFVLSLASAVGCKFGGNSPSGDTTERIKPNLVDILVDATEKPTAFFIGNYTLEKIEIDGVALAKDSYRVSNGYCIWQEEYYAAFGVGNHLVKFYFVEEIYEFSIVIKDNDVTGTDIYSQRNESDNDVIGQDLYID